VCRTLGDKVRKVFCFFFSKKKTFPFSLSFVYALALNSVSTLDTGADDKRKKGRLAMGDLISIGFGAAIFAFLLVYVNAAEKI
jgi:hypothetical protein